MIFLDLLEYLQLCHEMRYNVVWGEFCDIMSRNIEWRYHGFVRLRTIPAQEAAEYIPKRSTFPDLTVLDVNKDLVGC